MSILTLLVSQWGDYGLPPSQSSFGIHATIVNHYLNGGWYPAGGASEIARHILPVIEKASGKAIARREVIEILIQDTVLSEQ